MEIKILEDNKDEMKIEINNLTIAEILRVYLNKDDAVTLAVWKREHIEKNPVLYVKTKGKTAKKAIQDAISRIEKEAEKILDNLKKAK